MTDRRTTPPYRPRFLPRSTCALALGLAALALTSCGGRPIQPESFVKSAPAEQAMVMPPPAGPAVVSVIERRYDNAIGQDIHLATSASTPGQNLLKVQFHGIERTLNQSSNRLGTSMVTEPRIASEMRQLLPGVRMARSQFYVQNNYGPFGYAFGRGRGTDLCLYAWQQIRSRAATMSPLANYGSIQIRLRLCEAGATEAKLLAVMYNFTINASVDAAGWNPYGDARSFNPDIGGSSAPIYPRATSSEPIVQTLPPRRTVVYAPQASARRVQPSTVRVNQPAPPIQEPIGPAVPGPGSFGEGVSGRTDPSLPASTSAGDTASGQPRVTVPSPSCTMTTDGADVVCR
jgi:hypothetical protein